ncbi:gliding motility protein GldC [bacterium AH-315-C07]|nr:gliding motility protein GldC [bacterium AH-315-C07]
MSEIQHDKITKSSTITIDVHLNEQNVPLTMEWKGEDGENNEKHPCKAFMLSIWDTKESNTMRIDLWSKEMEVLEMEHFFVQSILTMGDTYQSATGNDRLAEELRNFAGKFGRMIEEERKKKMETAK